MSAGGPLFVVSAGRADTGKLVDGGPRRDFLEAAKATGGEVLYREGRLHKGLAGKLAGPHIRQAWRAAGGARQGQAIFADGEHVGLPLLAALAIRRRRPGRVVMIGHFVSKPWKLALLGIATRLRSRGMLILHSVGQERAAARWLGRRWQTALVPYQVDTEYWSAPFAPDDPPLVVAVGSENRDYNTLTQAVADLPVRCVVAAGSHWARTVAGAADLPANVEYLSSPLSFAELRDLYARASLVVVPLHDVPNQSGITTILEAMSMGLPVIVTATEGQRECVHGPLVRADGTRDHAATADRGSHHFGGQPAGDTGFYVPPDDPAALREALRTILDDPGLAHQLGVHARHEAASSFSLERFVEHVAALVVSPGGTGGARAAAAAEAGRC